MDRTEHEPTNNTASNGDFDSLEAVAFTGTHPEPAAAQRPQLSRVLSSVPDEDRSPEPMLVGLCRTAVQQFGACEAIVLLPEPVSGDLVVSASSSEQGLSARSVARYTRHGVLGEVLDQPCTRHFELAHLDTTERAAFPPEADRVSCIPIADSIGPLGLLVIAWDSRSSAASSEHITGEIPGLPVVAARLRAAAGGRVSGVDKLRLVAATISGMGPQTPAADLQSALVEVCRTVLDTDLVAVFTIDQSLGGIGYVATSGVAEPVATAFTSLFGDRIADTNLRHSWICDLSNERADRQDELLRPFVDAGIGIIAACPIRSEFGATGALTAFYPPSTRLGRSHISVLETTAAQLGTAMSYALTIEQSTQLLDGLAGENRELSQQATRDGLTGLANHRALQQYLKELARLPQGRRRRVFSLVMIDVDHFKAYNDAHGHQEGDAALRHVARVVSAGLRQNDLAARYGGEEFALVLRGIGKTDAEAVADRLRRSVADQPCPRGPLTVSMGVAEFPADGDTPGEVIERADKALYHAKITGRNRVVVWGSAGCGLAGAPADVPDTPRAVVSVLLVEPDEAGPGSGTPLRELLSEESYRIELASKAHEATSKLRTRSFDIAIVSDSVFPTRDWRELTNMASIHPDMPVVLVATDLPAKYSREVLRRGATDVLLRPCDPATLPVVVERNLERRRLEGQKLAQRSTGLMLQAIDALVAAIDARDPYTSGHSQRVTALSVAISEHLDISNEERNVLEFAARLHDIGKLGLPDTALNKQSPLTNEEWHAMREHPALGSRIVGTIDELSYVSTVIRHHHERLDGSGYPDGLTGPAIPFLSRIVAVADAYEAMTSERAYRSSLTPRDAIEQLRRGAGTHYDPRIVSALESCVLTRDCMSEHGKISGQAA